MQRDFNFSVWQAASTFSTDVQSYFPLFVAEGIILKRFEENPPLAAWQKSFNPSLYAVGWFKASSVTVPTSLRHNSSFHLSATRNTMRCVCALPRQLCNKPTADTNRREKNKMKNIKDWKSFGKDFFLRFALSIVCIIFSLHGLRWDMCVRFYSLFTRFNFLLCLCAETWRWRKPSPHFHLWFVCVE